MNTPKRLSSLLAILTIALCVVFAFSSCNLFECEHADANNDHLCDECSETLTECADADSNHKCDVCGKVLSECVDANTDHACDVCKANVGEHVNGEDDHTCDYCGEAASKCADADNDHLCDICYDVLSECVDANPKDHICDICENRSFGNCNDAEKDHECDYCGGNVGEHADSDPMTDGHNCNYCGESLCADVDTDEDHNCDVCGKKLCTDENENCVCDDENCGAPLHVDATLDHECDKCKGQVGEHADGTDGNHDCDYCFASLCAEGDVVDCKCDGCGAPLHVDAKNNESGEAGSDHKCDNCSVTLCYDSGDRDHKCDVCDASLCVDADEDHDCDVCEALMCPEGCETHKAPIITVYAEGTNCKVNGTNVVKFYGTEASYAVVPEYMASQYIIDLWVVYNAEGTKIAYIENGSEFVPTEGTYYIAPIFIANNLEGIFDTEGSVDVSDTNSTNINETVITPEWADVDASKKLTIFGKAPGQYPNHVVSASPNSQVYLTTDPTDAANVVLMVATRTGGTGGVGNTVIATPFDASSKGDGYLMSFDYYLDHNCSSADSTTILVVKDSDGNAFKIGVIVPAGKSMASVTADTATPTEGAFRFQSRHYNTLRGEKDTHWNVGNDGKEYKDSAGSVKQMLNSDTWYTFQIKIEFNKISTYYSLRGSNVFTLVEEYDFSNFSISERNLVAFEIQQGIYNSQALCYYDNVWFGKAHECVDANNDHNCDTCGVALCYDGIDADHNCDRCDANLCYEGDIADHNCDVCGATLSECADNDKTHYCDICGKGGFGEHADNDPMADGHNCNYCGKSLCVDEGKDHACDICNGLVGGECEDANKDHNCDYCGARKFGSVEGSTDCADAIELEDGSVKKDHKCDYCGVEMNMDKHVDVNNDGDHVCDYGCGAVLTECEDTDTEKDYKCNDCGKFLCEDINEDHKCDITDEHQCAWGVTVCVDENKDHICDFEGCKKVLSECADGETVDHVCDYCGEYNVAWCSDEVDNNHLCDLEACGKILSYCADGNADHKCDKCEKDVCTDANGDRICDNCNNVVAYNFEVGSIETSDNLVILNSSSSGNKPAADKSNVFSTTTLTTAGRPDGYNYASWMSLAADPENAANQVLSFNINRVEGGTSNSLSYVTATPVIVDADGTYTVMKFRMYIGTVDGSKNASHDVLYLKMYDATGKEKKAIVGYRTSTTATDADGNTVYALKSCGASINATTDMWVDMLLVSNNTEKKYYGYYSVDGGVTYTYANSGSTGLTDNITSVKLDTNHYQVNGQAYVDNWSNVRVSSVSISLTDGTTKEFAAPAAD